MTKSTLHISMFPVKTSCVSRRWLVSSIAIWYNNLETSSDDESCRIMMSAATLVKEEIHSSM